MFFKGEVYFESKLEHKFDINDCFNDFILNGSRHNIRLEFMCKHINFSWNHTNEWQAVVTVGFEVDDDFFGLNDSPETAKRFIRDLFDLYLTNDKLTPSYIEDATVESDEGDFIEVPDFYFISEEEFGDEQDDVASRVAWANYKRSEDFLAFNINAREKNPNVWRKELQNLRKENASAAPVKVKKRNMKHIEPETKENDKRKIFILDEDVI